MSRAAESIPPACLARVKSISPPQSLPARRLRWNWLLLRTVPRALAWRPVRVRTWSEAWGAGVGSFLQVFLACGSPDRTALSLARTQFISLLCLDLPAEVQKRRPRIPAAFHKRDQTH